LSEGDRNPRTASAAGLWGLHAVGGSFFIHLI